MQRYPLDPWYPTHVGSHDAASGTGQGQEEKRCGAQEASRTDQWVSPRVEAAKTAADLHTQAHTQNSSQARDESKNETRVKPKDEPPSLAYSAVGAWELLPLLQGPDPARAVHPNCPQTQTHPTQNPGAVVTSSHGFSEPETETPRVESGLKPSRPESKSLISPYTQSPHSAPPTHLSEEEHESPGRQGRVSPRTTRERSRNAGAQRAREPVTKATAVKPREDRTKLGLGTLGGSQTHRGVLSSSLAYSAVRSWM